MASLSNDDHHTLLGLGEDQQGQVLWSHNPTAIHAFPPAGPFIAYSIAGGLTPDGELRVIDPTAGAPPEDIVWTRWTNNVALTDDNLVYYRGWEWSSSADTRQLDPNLAIADITVGRNPTVCLLTEQGDILCFAQAGDVHTNGFDDPPYERIAMGAHAMCAQRADDHVVVCNDGSTHDWGPLRDLAVYSNEGEFYVYEDVPLPTSPIGQRPDGANVCAITIDNAIRCAGVRFPDELLQRLPGAR